MVDGHDAHGPAQEGEQTEGAEHALLVAYVCVYIYIYIYIYVCIHIYIYIHVYVIALGRLGRHIMIFLKIENYVHIECVYIYIIYMLSGLLVEGPAPANLVVPWRLFILISSSLL